MARQFIMVLAFLTLGTTLLSACSSELQNTFYVSPEGDDDADGSEAQPWQTLQASVNRLVAGDTLLARGGIYSERLIVVSSGSATEGPVVIANYPGETPVIDGSNITVGRGFFPLVLIRDQDYVRLEGFEIRNLRSEMGRRNPVGIFLSGRGSHIELVANNIHHIEAATTVGQRDGHGIAVYGTSENAITDVLIKNNQVHDLILGTSEAVVINGNVDGFEVIGNTVFDNDNIGIDIIGFEGKSADPNQDRARNGRVADNHVYGTDTANNPSYDERNAGGIYVDGGQHIVIENNVLHDNNMGIEIASEHASGDTSFVTVRNNVIFRNHIVGLAMGGYDSNRGQTFSCEVIGNTFYDNDTDGIGNGEFLLQFDVSNNRVTDNVVVAGADGILLANPFVENSGNVFDHNLYFAPAEPSWQWQTEIFTNLDAYREATGNDANSALLDPDFVNPSAGDFTSPEGSAVGSTGSLEHGAGANDDMLLRTIELSAEL